MQSTDASERIAMFQEGKIVPRFPSQPSLSSAARWAETKLERHRLKMEEELAGTICGYQICFNLGAASAVTWKNGGRLNTKLIQPGQLSIAPHGQLRTVRWAATMNLLLFSISTKLLQEFSAEISTGRMPELVEHYGHSDVQMQNLLHLLQSDLISGSPAGFLFGEQLGTAVAVYMTERFSTKPLRTHRCNSGLPGMVLNRVLDYVESNLSEQVSLETLAKVAGISRFYFTRLFRNSTGQSPSHYLTKQRIERAKHLLTGTAMGLPEISVQTGFSSHSHLTAVFHKATGITPGKYRLLAH